jgi:FeS assembly SUF system regulator
MMRLSRLSDYAVVLMTHIAQHPQRVHTAASVAAATRVPVPTVAKLLVKLRRNGLLVSTRGVKGGYALVRPPTAISVSELVAALDGPIALTVCIGAGRRGCEIEDVCPSRWGLHRINQAVREALDAISLADIAALAPAGSPATQAGSGSNRAYDALPFQVS